MKTITANFICIISIFCFALTFPAADSLLERWNIITLLSIRNVLAVTMIYLFLFYIEGFKGIFTPSWLEGIWIGFFGFGIGSILLLITQYLTSPVVAALTVAMMPLAGVGLELVFDNRKITNWFFIGLVCVFFGGLLALGLDLKDSRFGFGALLGICGTVLFAWASRKTSKSLSGMSIMAKTAITSFGMTIFSISALVLFLPFKIEAPTLPQILATDMFLIFIYAIIGVAVSQTLWIMSVYNLGIGIASFHLNAAPFYVMIVLFFLGEQWNWQQTFGALLVIVGVIISQKKHRK